MKLILEEIRQIKNPINKYGTYSFNYLNYMYKYSWKTILLKRTTILDPIIFKWNIFLNYIL